MLTLVYSSPEKVDKREDWQKSGKYRYCHAIVSWNEDTGKDEFLVCYREWGFGKKDQFLEGFPNYSAAQLAARGMNIKG